MSNSGASAKPTIPVIVGPTAVGKTAVALDLARRFNLEIVSCDSRQIYKYMNIGTAKPTPEELGGTPYWLIDYVEPNRTYSSALYRTDAIREIERILDSGRVPLIVGGTGLYLKAVMVGFFATPEPDESYRKELEALDATALYNMLMEIDLQAAKAIPQNNRLRVIRALEIHKLTGKTKTELSSKGDYPPSRYNFEVFELNRSREKLYQFINFRVDKMIGDGLIDEVEHLREIGFGQSPVLKQTVGYREVIQYLQGEISRDECIGLIKQKTRNYAKRQITWFRPDPSVVRIDLECETGLQKLIGELDKLKLDT